MVDTGRRRMASSVTRSRAAWSALAAAVVCFGLVAFDIRAVLQLNDGTFTYPQDDPYIHLTLARNLAASGTWGLEPGRFAPASSSPLWTLALAGLSVAWAPSIWWPLALNCIGAAAVIYAVARQLSVLDAFPVRTGVLVALVLILPLPTLVLIGMEHTIHVACIVVLTGAAIEVASATDRDRWWASGLVLAAVATGLRYETLFVVSTLSLILVVRRRWRAAVSMVAGAVLPVMAYAAYALGHGAPALPNSILMKSGATRFGSVGAVVGVLGDWVRILTVYQRPVQVALALAALLLLALRRPARRLGCADLWLIVFLATEVFHVCLVRIEWFYRYEAYVVALGCIAVARGLAERWRAPDARRWWELSRRTVAGRAVLACGVLLALPLVQRAAESRLTTARGSHEVYLQQYQMGQFFASEYAGHAVALNDIGAVSWLAPVHVVDIVGLASPEIADARRAGRFDRKELERLAQRRGVDAICVYEDYLEGNDLLPPGWHRVGEWVSITNIAVNDDRVTFYAPSREAATRLRKALDAFSARLPSEVTPALEQ